VLRSVTLIHKVTGNIVDILDILLFSVFEMSKIRQESFFG